MNGKEGLEGSSSAAANDMAHHENHHNCRVEREKGGGRQIKGKKVSSELTRKHNERFRGQGEYEVLLGVSLTTLACETSEQERGYC